ncbi:MAG TPA: hypothetical protein VI248_06045 [Kineosporiaceae bacterium]
MSDVVTSPPGDVGRNPPVLQGQHVYRVHWALGTDRLHAMCFCGADREFEEPIELWNWLHAHPEGHRPPAVTR